MKFRSCAPTQRSFGFPLTAPDLQFQYLQDIVNSFTFPHSSHRLPLTAIKRVFSQLLFSKIRPRLNAQPINPVDAESLDHAIANKVHSYLGMPFRFRSYTLHSPVNAWGMGFLSVARLNELAAVNGLLRDLNHHIPIFLRMSRTTLSDWSCTRSNCRSPF
ncbi:hypothetical protein DFP72DRAFT_805108, partial [Ephemerocybe angulata]